LLDSASSGLKMLRRISWLNLSLRRSTHTSYLTILLKNRAALSGGQDPEFYPS
jgi:hypothetical protein